MRRYFHISFNVASESLLRSYYTVKIFVWSGININSHLQKKNRHIDNSFILSRARYFENVTALWSFWPLLCISALYCNVDISIITAFSDHGVTSRNVEVTALSTPCGSVMLIESPAGYVKSDYTNRRACTGWPLCSGVA